MAINNTTCQNFTSPTTGIEYNVADGSTDPTTDVINPKRQDGLWVSKRFKKNWADSSAVERKGIILQYEKAKAEAQKKAKRSKQNQKRLKKPEVSSDKESRCRSGTELL